MGNSELIQQNSLCLGKDATKELSVGSILLGTFNEFKDSFFYSYFIQFVLVGYMYKTMGHGKYWKIMFLSSLLGLCGAICEHFTVVVVCSNKYDGGMYIMFWIQEIFWILTEYAIPYLNFIKIKAIAQNKMINPLKYVLIVLFVLFAVARGIIGKMRFDGKTLFNSKIYVVHGVAFSIMSLADIICTIFILKEMAKTIKKERQKLNTEKTLSECLQSSSYTTLLLVDLCSIVLTVLALFFEILPGSQEDKSNDKLSYAVVPFHTIKSNFILILAVDALVFKIRVSASQISSSHEITDIKSGSTNGKSLGSIGGMGSYSNIIGGSMKNTYDSNSNTNTNSNNNDSLKTSGLMYNNGLPYNNTANRFPRTNNDTKIDNVYKSPNMQTTQNIASIKAPSVEIETLNNSMEMESSNKYLNMESEKTPLSNIPGKNMKKKNKNYNGNINSNNINTSSKYSAQNGGIGNNNSSGKSKYGNKTSPTYDNNKYTMNYNSSNRNKHMNNNYYESSDDEGINNGLGTLGSGLNGYRNIYNM